jgi:hypothetical protein
VVYAAIKRRVIVDRRYREAIMRIWWAAHLLGRCDTQSGSSLHVGRMERNSEPVRLGLKMLDTSLRVWGRGYGERSADACQCSGKALNRSNTMPFHTHT